MSEDKRLFSSLSLEGEFTDWALQWQRDVGAFIQLTTVHVDNFGRVYASDAAWNSYVIDRDNNLTANPGYVFDDANLQLGQRIGSVTRKYMIDVEAVANRIFRVWRYGAVIDTVNVFLLNPDYDEIYHTAISANGRYIALTIQSVATGLCRYILLYMGG